MSTSMKLCLAALIFYTLLFSGIYAKCDFNNGSLTVGTVRTGNEIQGKPEWAVTIVNECECALSNLYLRCSDFQTVEPVKPEVYKKVGDICVVVGGNRIYPKQQVQFSYAWDPPLLMYPVKGNFDC